LVEFRSASSEIRRRKKKKEESVVKYKSADNYVGRPNELTTAAIKTCRENLKIYRTDITFT